MSFRDFVTSSSVLMALKASAEANEYHLSVNFMTASFDKDTAFGLLSGSIGAWQSEDPLSFVAGHWRSSKANLEFDTIAVFYHFLAKKIEELGQSIFLLDARKVAETKSLPDPDDVFVITDVVSAKRGIDVIFDQGEGISKDLFDVQDESAQYFRVGLIARGRQPIHTGDSKKSYAFSGVPVTFTESDVWNMEPDPAIAKYKPGSFLERKVVQFSYSYTRALNALRDIFKRTAEVLDDALNGMYELRLLAQQVLATPAKWVDATCKRRAFLRI